MSVTYPLGFRAAGVTAGFKPSGQPDLGVLVGDAGTTAAALFTTNAVAAAPVQVGRDRIGRGRVRAVLVNSGQANAGTGSRGIDDAMATSAAFAALIGASAEEVLPSSTGVIGEPLHVSQMCTAMPTLVGALSADGGESFARAIMTTDTVDKQASAHAGTFRVGGCAKGVGMVAPSLATMLAFLTTDAAVAREDLQRLAAGCLAPRFDGLTVDGCTSTNDTVVLLASGAAGREPVTPGTEAWRELSAGFDEVGQSLVAQLIADGEGATDVMIVEVDGAESDDDARRVAKAVADSPLVKTAVFGGDPNPGRFLQAVGAAHAPVDAARLDVSIGGVEVAIGGVIPPAYFEPASALAQRARAAMKEAEIAVSVRLGDGRGTSRAYGCDLSYEYVRINGEYTT
ncbi:MAG: bifunctional glutamate N-acetyltransferase/amino-acid acetyltransferase ArgJ [Actinomycetota bacterium]|nr:bifunctional glutamate N-acetyltransferase/amino-acid acetyltransferase ArgJ [Actinomycetota bacterium]